MNPAFDRKRTAILIAFAFGISWATGGYLASHGALLFKGDGSEVQSSKPSPAIIES